jgi:hypothetical protein
MSMMQFLTFMFQDLSHFLGMMLLISVVVGFVAHVVMNVCGVIISMFNAIGRRG